MTGITKKTKVIEGLRPDNIPYDDLMAECQPVLLKGVAKEWGLVRAGLESYDSAIDYLKSFYNGRTVGVYHGAPDTGGRYFYNEELTGLNFESRRRPLDETLDEIRQYLDQEQPPALYVGSTTLDACLPDMRAENDLVFNSEMFADNLPLTSIWIGNRSTASAHYDAPNNIACCVVGKRRFTLFPPDQIANLYPGPLDPTPGGQAVSMVNFNDPDLEQFPNFRQAQAVGEVADMEPGDALFYPSLWWHHVEAFSPFNVLINYWWNTSPKYMGTPMNVVYHALLSLRDRPEHEKQAWKAIFDYYIFGDANQPREHLPSHAHGDLGPIDDVKARRLRAYLINRLNR